MASYGTYCVASIVSLIGFITAAVLIEKSYELDNLKTENACSAITSGVVYKPKVDDKCNVWYDKTQTCFKGQIVNANGQLACEKKLIVPALICLVLAGVSLIAAIAFGYMYYNK